MNDVVSSDPYYLAFRGSFKGVLRWPQLDALWKTLRGRAGLGWYVYAVGEEPPAETAAEERLVHFIEEIDELLRREHEEEYCGIVYTDSFDEPTYVKIFDPHNLGVSCGFSENPPLPGWILSLIPPCDLPAAMPHTGSRKRWWRKIFR
ncbi:hypothetical protein [Endothiovibrio diazotrophicus]